MAGGGDGNEYLEASKARAAAHREREISKAEKRKQQMQAASQKWREKQRETREAAVAAAAAGMEEMKVEEVTIRDLPRKREAAEMDEGVGMASGATAAAGPSGGEDERADRARARAHARVQQEAAQQQLGVLQAVLAEVAVRAEVDVRLAAAAAAAGGDRGREDVPGVELKYLTEVLYCIVAGCTRVSPQEKAGAVQEVLVAVSKWVRELWKREARGWRAMGVFLQHIADRDAAGRLNQNPQTVLSAGDLATVRSLAQRRAGRREAHLREVLPAGPSGRGAGGLGPPGWVDTSLADDLVFSAGGAQFFMGQYLKLEDRQQQRRQQEEASGGGAEKWVPLHQRGTVQYALLVCVLYACGRGGAGAGEDAATLRCIRVLVAILGERRVLRNGKTAKDISWKNLKAKGLMAKGLSKSNLYRLKKDVEGKPGAREALHGALHREVVMELVHRGDGAAGMLRALEEMAEAGRGKDPVFPLGSAGGTEELLGPCLWAIIRQLREEDERAEPERCALVQAANRVLGGGEGAGPSARDGGGDGAREEEGQQLLSHVVTAGTGWSFHDVMTMIFQQDRRDTGGLLSQNSRPGIVAAFVPPAGGNTDLLMMSTRSARRARGVANIVMDDGCAATGGHAGLQVSFAEDAGTERGEKASMVLAFITGTPTALADVGLKDWWLFGETSNHPELVVRKVAFAATKFRPPDGMLEGQYMAQELGKALSMFLPGGKLPPGRRRIDILFQCDGTTVGWGIDNGWRAILNRDPHCPFTIHLTRCNMHVHNNALHNAVRSILGPEGYKWFMDCLLHVTVASRNLHKSGKLKACKFKMVRLGQHTRWGLFVENSVETVDQYDVLLGLLVREGGQGPGQGVEENARAYLGCPPWVKNALEVLVDPKFRHTVTLIAEIFGPLAKQCLSWCQWHDSMRFLEVHGFIVDIAAQITANVQALRNKHTANGPTRAQIAPKLREVALNLPPGIDLFPSQHQNARKWPASAEMAACGLEEYLQHILANTGGYFEGASLFAGLNNPRTCGYCARCIVQELRAAEDQKRAWEEEEGPEATLGPEHVEAPVAERPALADVLGHMAERGDSEARGHHVAVLTGQQATEEGYTGPLANLVHLNLGRLANLKPGSDDDFLKRLTAEADALLKAWAPTWHRCIEARAKEKRDGLKPMMRARGLNTRPANRELQRVGMLEALIDTDFWPMPEPGIHAFGIAAAHGEEIKQLASGGREEPSAALQDVVNRHFAGHPITNVAGEGAVKTHGAAMRFSTYTSDGALRNRVCGANSDAIYVPPDHKMPEYRRREREADAEGAATKRAFAAQVLDAVCNGVMYAGQAIKDMLEMAAQMTRDKAQRRRRKPQAGARGG